MKRALTFSLVLVILLPAVVSAIPLLEFDRMQYDFGRVNQGEMLSYEFKFFNRGDEDLIIEKIVPS